MRPYYTVLKKHLMSITFSTGLMGSLFENHLSYGLIMYMQKFCIGTSFHELLKVLFFPISPFMFVFIHISLPFRELDIFAGFYVKQYVRVF